MCTVVFLRRSGHDWPIVIGANRDEMIDRPWRGPGRHWSDRPEIIAGIDELAGGTWMGVNDYGVVAGILNRSNSLGPSAGKRSRGEVVLEALDHADAALAAEALSDLNVDAYRPFNLFVADSHDAFWIRNDMHDGAARMDIFGVPEGVSMLTARDLSDTTSPRVSNYLSRFRSAPAPQPECGDWTGWADLLAARDRGDHCDDPAAAMAIVTDSGFGTVSSALVGIPRAGINEGKVEWLFAAGVPGEVPFERITL